MHTYTHRFIIIPLICELPFATPFYTLKSEYPLELNPLNTEDISVKEQSNKLVFIV